MAQLNRPERLQVMLSGEELAALDDWRFAKRMPSRAAAIRDLLRLGLAAEGVDLAEKRRPSGNFGVLDDSQDGRQEHGSPSPGGP
jgi:hypothetical protein